MRMRTHCAASRRLGTDTRTPTLPGAAGGSHVLIVAHGDGRNWAPAGGAPAATPAVATARSAPPRRRTAAMELTPSPYRARRRGVVLGVGAGRPVVAGGGRAARAADDRAVEAPLERDHAAQDERGLPVRGRRERERAPAL